MARSIMIQGTMSNAGKSVLAAGLCRIFRAGRVLCGSLQEPEYGAEQFHHREGLEMGRAR